MYALYVIHHLAMICV